jgi:YgiT-type zinc finger domain-containing protein
MKCVWCGGELKHDSVTFSYEDYETYMLVEHVPADVCLQCGEKLSSPEVTDAFGNEGLKPIEPLSSSSRLKVEGR